MLATDVVFKLDDGSIYDVEQACFIETATPLKKVVEIHTAEDADPIKYLKLHLEHFGFTVGRELLTFEEAKAAKLQELTAAARSILDSLTVETSIGYTVDANTDSLVNIANLIEAGESPVEFTLSDNTSAELTLEQLKTIKPELFAARQAVYKKKWAARDFINYCESKDGLDAITWDDELNLTINEAEVIAEGDSEA